MVVTFLSYRLRALHGDYILLLCTPELARNEIHKEYVFLVCFSWQLYILGKMTSISLCDHVKLLKCYSWVTLGIYFLIT